jgi:peptidoglycan/xylan/chitin deacetylase (PgdA/CDA1 family)
MSLKSHGRFDYHGLPGRGVYDWPNGTRLCVYLGLNLEHFAFGEGLGAELAPGGPHPDVLNHAWREYGNRIGAWRLRELFEALELPASVLVNSALYAHAPELVRAFRMRGDEIVAHGRSNSERQGTLDEAAEAELIDEATRVISTHEGAQPRGWLGPWISQSHATPDLLQEAGYAYLLDWCMDDQPIWLRTRKGRILAVPYPQELNDIPAIMARKLGADAFADMIVDNFDEMLEQSAGGPLVMGIALHAYIVGQPFRLRHLRRALAHIARHRDRIWLASAGAVASHVLSLPEGMVPGSGD